MFGEVWRVLFHIDHSTSMYEGIVRHGLALTEFNSFVRVEGSSKLVSVSYVENTSIKLNVDANSQVFPGVGLDRAGFGH